MGSMFPCSLQQSPGREGRKGFELQGSELGLGYRV